LGEADLLSQRPLRAGKLDRLPNVITERRHSRRLPEFWLTGKRCNKKSCHDGQQSTGNFCSP
jgi:hypothetical protein